MTDRSRRWRLLPTPDAANERIRTLAFLISEHLYNTRIALEHDLAPHLYARQIASRNALCVYADAFIPRNSVADKRFGTVYCRLNSLLHTKLEVKHYEVSRFLDELQSAGAVDCANWIFDSQALNTPAVLNSQDMLDEASGISCDTGDERC